MNTILIFVMKQENLIKVVYKQGRGPKQELEEYPNCKIQTYGGQVNIYKEPYKANHDPILTVPVSRTIIKYVD